MPKRANVFLLASLTTDHTTLVHHLILTGPTIRVSFASTLLIGKIAEEPVGCCRRLEGQASAKSGVGDG